MAREKSCNLDKEEAEILKPSSPSSSSPAPSPAATPSLFHIPPQEPPPPPRAQAPQPAPASEPSAPTSSGDAAKSSDREREAEAPGRFANRCSSCWRRVGLTGFRCRCGDLFCPRHRYSDTHDCSFDYKAAGREQISKANPLIRAAKIIKI